MGLAGLIFCSTLLLTPEKIEVAKANPIAVPVQEVPFSMKHAEPTGLSIPSLGIDAPFISLDVKRDGSMETPSDGDTVGWYKHAPTPGELGPAIVAAHVDTKAGPAVFAKLHLLKPGDTFEITRADGTLTKFQVNEVKQYPQNDFATKQVYGNIDYAGIRLITCGGMFSQSTKRYSHNTIIFGSLVSK